MTRTKRLPLGGGVFVYTNRAHTFGTDTVLLADFAAPSPGEISCDLGTGCAAIPLLWRIILLFLEYANFAPVSPFVKRYSSALFPNFCIMRVHPLHIHMFMKISAFDEFLAKVMQFLIVSVILPPS